MRGTVLVSVASDILDDWVAQADRVREFAAIEAAAAGGALLDDEPAFEFHEQGAHVRYQMQRAS